MGGGDYLLVLLELYLERGVGHLERGLATWRTWLTSRGGLATWRGSWPPGGPGGQVLEGGWPPGHLADRPLTEIPTPPRVIVQSADPRGRVVPNSV